MCKLFSSDDKMGVSVETMAPALIQYMNSLSSLPWKDEVHPDSSEHILRFCLLAMEVKSGFCFLLDINN